MSSIPGTEYLSGALNVISQSLTIPVMVLLLIIAVVSVIALGGFISEYTSMKKVGVGKIRDLIFKINTAASVDDLMNVISGSDIPKSQKKVLTEIAKSEALDSDSREALARKLVEHEEEKIDKSLRNTDIITRVGPTLGLMGTLIPLGPGLAALGAGDVNTLADALTIAFDTTVVGIGSGALCYFISKIRRGWYDQYLSDLDALSDAVLFLVRRKQRRRRASDDDIDPMAGTTNLVDAMLVLALGFLIFVVISWNMQSVIFSDMSQDQKQAVMESMKQVSEVTQGQELNDTPDTSQSSGQGFTELGKVYKDPSSGKLIMVEG